MKRATIFIETTIDFEWDTKGFTPLIISGRATTHAGNKRENGYVWEKITETTNEK